MIPVEADFSSERPLSLEMALVAERQNRGGPLTDIDYEFKGPDDRRLKPLNQSARLVVEV